MLLTHRKPDYISKTAFRAMQVILEPIAKDSERLDLITIGAGFFQFGDHK